MTGQIPHNSYRKAIFDCPWEQDTYSDLGKAKSAAVHYDTMTTPEIMALKDTLGLDWCFAPDCIAVFWGTWPMMARGDVHAVVRHFGFTPVTGGSWHKITVHGKDSFGGGYYWRDSCEPYLVGTRGDPGRPPKGQRNWRNGFRALRREHSRKPDYIHRSLEAMYPDGTAIEFFARKRRRGWDAWGKEVGLFDGELPEQPRSRVPQLIRPVQPAPLLEALGEP